MIAAWDDDFDRAIHRTDHHSSETGAKNCTVGVDELAIALHSEAIDQAFSLDSSAEYIIEAAGPCENGSLGVEVGTMFVCRGRGAGGAPSLLSVEFAIEVKTEKASFPARLFVGMGRSSRDK